MIGPGKQGWFWLLAIALFVLVPVHGAQAIMARPEPIDGPVPENWKAPLGELLQKLGFPDVQGAVNGTRMANPPLWKDTKFDESAGLLLQVQTPDTCSRNKDQCLTIIARLSGSTLVADLLFYAGIQANIFDVFRLLPNGRSTTTMFFHSQNIVMGLQWTPIGWMLNASPQDVTK